MVGAEMSFEDTPEECPHCFSKDRLVYKSNKGKARYAYLKIECKACANCDYYKITQEMR